MLTRRQCAPSCLVPVSNQLSGNSAASKQEPYCRGDVGSWVRGAAMAGLVAVLPLLAAISPSMAAPLVSRATAAMAKQAVERIARLRQVTSSS